MSRPDPTRSTALLIGTATHSQQALDDLPAVRANVTELARLVTTGPVDLVAVDRCTQLLDLSHPGEAGVTIAERCGEAEDLLLVYYAGHGLLDDNGELFLALSGTNPRPDWLKYTAIPFSWIRDAMRDSPARTRVLILDCCFAGRALNTMSAADVENGLADRSEIQGTFTLTATSDNVAAIAPVGAEHTAFTGELLSLLRHGPPVRDGHPDGEDLTLSAVYRHLAVTLPSQGLPRPRQRNTDLAADLVLRPGPGAPPAAEDQPSGETPAVAPASNLPALTVARPVLDTLRRPQRLFHPLHRELLRVQRRRLAVSVGIAALYTVFLLARLVVPEVTSSRGGWPGPGVFLTILDIAAAAVGTALALTAARDAREGFPGDARIKWGLAIVIWGVVAVLLMVTVAMRVVVPLLGDYSHFVVPFGSCVFALALWWFGGQKPRDESGVLRMWWRTPFVVAVVFGAMTALYATPDPVLGETRFISLLESHALGEVWTLAGFLTIGFLLVVQFQDVLTGHLALSKRPLVVSLSKQGIGIQTRAHNRFIAWHHLDRIFVAGNVLVIAFKRDYPEVEKPREFTYSAELGGFPVADLRHFPHSRAEILHALSHFAGGTLHGVTPPGPEEDRLPTRPDGRPALRYSDRWSTQ
ncbi:caspase family protein [Micromonospora sp. B9E7]|uniref:caspase family protein n=1 Tax=Micromonospora sp. B9E7 TaxID=3153574 RepID=UPI00325D66DA